ncbi:MAG: hypothetical protein M3162_00920 [Thermoproteota archaeon]|nr:hypothetical protein [Thermoproteota archaeon]
MGKKEILIPPVIIGAATLFGIVFMQFIPPPDPVNVCLKAHDVDTFNIYPRVQLFVDGSQYYLPADLGKQPKDNKECLRVIHSDSVGEMLHVQFVRPIKLSMAELMEIYSPDGETIRAVDNSTGNALNKTLDLGNYDTYYSYYSENGAFTIVDNITKVPPFSNDFVGRINFTSK